jgi:hypothetical protein
MWLSKTMPSMNVIRFNLCNKATIPNLCPISTEFIFIKFLQNRFFRYRKELQRLTDISMYCHQTVKIRFFKKSTLGDFVKLIPR